MGKFNKFAAVLAAVSTLAFVPQPAAAAVSADQASKLRQLDIMLMVTGERCRTTRDDFISDYGRFSSRHLGTLNQANAQLWQQLAVRHGSGGAQRALDRLSTTMANDYRLGHPWLGCRELKMVARNLANVEGRATLEEAADQLIARGRPSQIAHAQP